MAEDPDAFEFARLSDLPEMVDACAAMNDAEWGDGSEDSLDMRKAGFRRLALAAEEEDVILCLATDGSLAGICILIENDLEGFPDIGPWLASLIVAPDYRGRGLSKRLVQETEDLARSFGEVALFLYTKSPDFYRRYGYQFVDNHEKDGVLFTVLGKNL